jgi:hypothetical protein
MLILYPIGKPLDIEQHFKLKHINIYRSCKFEIEQHFVVLKI